MTDVQTATPAEPEQELSPAERAAIEAISSVMSDARKRTPTIDPAEDEDTEGIDYVRTGWIHVMVDGVLYRLRPVTMGNLKRLRVALEDAMEEQRGNIHRANVQIRACQAENARLEEIPVEDRTEENYYEPAFKVRGDLQKIQRELGHQADALREGWYKLVFKTLSTPNGDSPKMPRELPAWVANQDLPEKWIEHWRSVPLGRG